MGRRRGAGDPRPHARHPPDRDRPFGGIRSADARQPCQCRRADRRSSRHTLLLDRRPVRRWRLSHRRQAAEGHARRLRLHVDPGAGGASVRVGARQSFRAEPRPARLSAARRRHRDHADVRPCACARPGRRPVPDALRLSRAPRRRARRGARRSARRPPAPRRQRRRRPRRCRRRNRETRSPGRILCLRPDRDARGRQGSLGRERTAGRQAALRNLRQQRPAPGCSFHGKDSSPRQDDRRRRPSDLARSAGGIRAST